MRIQHRGWGPASETHEECTAVGAEPQALNPKQATGLRVNTVTAVAPAKRAAYGTQGQGPMSPTVQGDTAQQAGSLAPLLRTSRAPLLLFYSKKKISPHDSVP